MRPIIHIVIVSQKLSGPNYKSGDGLVVTYIIIPTSSFVKMPIFEAEYGFP